MFEPMTRTRTRTYGVAIPSTRQPLLAAMLRAFCWLVSNVVSTCRTIFNRRNRDWHTDETHEDQLPMPNDPTQKEAHTFEPSFSGKRSARIPRIPVASTRGTTPYSLCALNQDAWDKPKHDSLDDQEAELQLRGGHGLRHTRSLSPRSFRRKSGSRADVEPCPALQLQSCVRSTPILGFRRLIPSVSKDVGMSGICCGLQRALTA